MTVYLGIDFGTSGARAAAINQSGQILASGKQSFTHSSNHNLTTLWQNCLFSLLREIPLEQRQQLQAIAINGTSATVLLLDRQGKSLSDPILYSDARGLSVQDRLNNLVPLNHVAASATSSLAKLLWWSEQFYFNEASYFLHQADWLAGLLHGKWGISDYHNALKLGYDVEALRYPDWLLALPFQSLLPQVLAPGTPVGSVIPAIAKTFSIPTNCQVCSGTTDSIAAFLASDVSQPGESVTSLGSTLVLKLLSQTRIEASDYGIYSHRLSDLWLAGGASNAGGAVLRQFFSEDRLNALSKQINPNQESPYDYYPLLQPGERFPINDPQMPPKLTPRPTNEGEFLHGLLESLARIEKLGYQRLQTLGATPVTKIYTAGGGAKNQTWQIIRERQLGIPVSISQQTEAAYGTALLARSGLNSINENKT